MDSLVALALMRKAQLAFELDGNFMSFPTTSPTYTGGDFAFMQANPTVPQEVAFREFSQLVDHIPRGPVLDPTVEESLSSVFTNLLKGGEAQLAASTRTSAEEAQYAAAMNLLYVANADGTRSDTSKMLAYRQYRDAWYTLRLDINNRKIDADLSTDPVVKQRWQQVDEPALQLKLTDLESAWAAKGFRQEVEDAQQVVDRLGAKSPSADWNGWRGLCSDDIDRPTDPESNQAFWPAVYSPSNVLGTGGWISFTLLGSDVQSLAKDAPSDLRGRWKDQADLEIEKLTFECTTVRVERSWFSPEVFSARFWRLPAGAAPLSTGADLAAGRAPAYVAAAVLVRNITVTLKPDSANNTAALQKFKAARFIPIGNIGVKAATEPSGKIVLRSVATPLHPAPAAAVALAAPAAHVAAPVTAHFITPAAAHVMKPVLLGHAVATPPVAIRPVAVTGMTTIKRVMIPAGFPTDVRPPAPEPTVTFDPSTHVLGLICKHVPVSPNPDSSLTW